MFVLSLRTQIEEANTTGKNLTGAIRSYEFLANERSLIALEDAHPGFFSYLAFHPTADATITDYIKVGTLPADSGPNNMVLFTLDAQATWPTDVKTVLPELPFLDIDRTTHASYAAVRYLFEPKTPPPLPGIAIFRRFTGEHDVIYADLSGLSDRNDVTARIRAVLACAEKAFTRSEQKERDFADELAIVMEKVNLPFIRTGRVAMRQWLIRVYRFTEEHIGDLVSAVGLIT
jgi:hypothetical protein